jgi:site-specific DNA-cytosine methylase
VSIPVVSLFSGCGGLDLGFAQQDFASVLALDVNPSLSRRITPTMEKALLKWRTCPRSMAKTSSRYLRSERPRCPKASSGIALPDVLRG